MLSLAYPWLGLLLPLPWLVRRLLPPVQQSRPALQVPFLDRLIRISGQTVRRGSSVPRQPLLLLTLLSLAWCLTVLALIRPQWLEPPLERVEPSRALLLAVDLSGSMETADFPRSDGALARRIDGVKDTLSAFIEHREGDRIGLLVFGTRAYVQVPFTDDLDVVQTLLAEIEPRTAGPKTALGDAIGLGVQLFKRSDLEEQVMIILTDGNDTGSQVPPERAAGIAAEHGIVVHAIGVGAAQAGSDEGLDETLLRQITGMTGGNYFSAADVVSLVGVTKAIDAITPDEVRRISYRPRRELFQIPLGAALALAFLAVLFDTPRRAARDNPAAPRSQGQT